MTESQWLACQTPRAEFVRKAVGKTSIRKQQLIAVAACRLEIAPLEEPVFQRALNALEGYAEGFVSDEEFVFARAEVSTFQMGISELTSQVTMGTFALEWAMLTEPVLELVSYPLTQLSKQRSPPGRKRDAEQATKRAICDIYREIVGNPFRTYLIVPIWQGGGLVQPDGRTVMFTDSVKGLANAVHVTGDFGRLPILADALEEAGVTDEALLAHCRDGGPHLRGCWALDVARGRA